MTAFAVVNVTFPEAGSLLARLERRELVVGQPTLFVHHGDCVSYTFASPGSAGRRHFFRVALSADTRQRFWFTSADREFLNIKEDKAIAFCIASSGQLPEIEFEYTETPTAGVVCRLLGADSEMRRLLSRVSFFYLAGRPTIIELTFTDEMRYRVRVDDPTVPIVDADGRLSIATHRSVVQWYRQQCATMQTLVVGVLYRPGVPGSNSWPFNESNRLPGWERVSHTYQCSTAKDGSLAAEWWYISAIAGPAATAKLQTHRLRSVPLLPSNVALDIVASPYNCVPSASEFERQYVAEARRGYRVGNRSLASVVRWAPVVHSERRFYAHFQALVAFVAALSSLALPVYIYDELAMWTGVGTFLLEKWRIAAIQSTLDSCRRVRGARRAAPAVD